MTKHTFTITDFIRLNPCYFDSRNTLPQLFSCSENGVSPDYNRRISVPEMYQLYGFDKTYLALYALLSRSDFNAMMTPFWGAVIQAMIQFIATHHPDPQIETRSLKACWQQRRTSTEASAAFARAYAENLRAYLIAPTQQSRSGYIFPDLDYTGHHNRQHTFAPVVTACYQILDPKGCAAFWWHNILFNGIKTNPTRADGSTIYPDIYLGEPYIPPQTRAMLFEQAVVKQAGL